MAVAGAGAKIMAKVGAGAENKKFRLRNTEKKVQVILEMVCCGWE